MSPTASDYATYEQALECLRLQLVPPGSRRSSYRAGIGGVKPSLLAVSINRGNCNPQTH